MSLYPCPIGRASYLFEETVPQRGKAHHSSRMGSAVMTDSIDAQASLEGVLKDEIIRMYQEVADKPEAEFHFFHGREAAELFDYDAEWLDRAPSGAVASFAGVGNPHLRSAIQPGETVLDLGSGAGLDGIIASWSAGPTGRVIGLDLNPSMCLKAQANAAADGTAMECHEGKMEDIPLPDESVDVVISNGVINLSFQKRKVIEEVFRVLKPGGRISITDIVSGKQLSQSIVNDPKLWAS
jgi:arsenite methyltransferase